MPTDFRQNMTMHVPTRQTGRSGSILIRHVQTNQLLETGGQEFRSGYTTYSEGRVRTGSNIDISQFVRNGVNRPRTNPISNVENLNSRQLRYVLINMGVTPNQLDQISSMAGNSYPATTRERVQRIRTLLNSID